MVIITIVIVMDWQLHRLLVEEKEEMVAQDKVMEMIHPGPGNPQLLVLEEEEEEVEEDQME